MKPDNAKRNEEGLFVVRVVDDPLPAFGRIVDDEQDIVVSGEGHLTR